MDLLFKAAVCVKQDDVTHVTEYESFKVMYFDGHNSILTIVFFNYTIIILIDRHHNLYIIVGKI